MSSHDNVVIALVKLENLKAIHNGIPLHLMICLVVIALVKLENLKAIHNKEVCEVLRLVLLLH